MKFCVTIDWPEKLLWSNGQRGHYQAYNAAVGMARNFTKIRTITTYQRLGVRPTLEMLGGDPVPVLLVVSGHAKGRLPDRMNCASAIKPHIDGICDALKIDDRYFDAVRVQFADVREGWMRIELGNDEESA